MKNNIIHSSLQPEDLKLGLLLVGVIDGDCKGAGQFGISKHSGLLGEGQNVV